jgi:hypothetical protein
MAAGNSRFMLAQKTAGWKEEYQTPDGYRQMTKKCIGSMPDEFLQLPLGASNLAATHSTACVRVETSPAA